MKKETEDTENAETDNLNDSAEQSEIVNTFDEDQVKRLWHHLRLKTQSELCPIMCNILHPRIYT